MDKNLNFGGFSSISCLLNTRLSKTLRVDLWASIVSYLIKIKYINCIFVSQCAYLGYSVSQWSKSWCLRICLNFSPLNFVVVLFHFLAPGIPSVLCPINLQFCTDNLHQYFYIYSANFIYVACKLIKLEASENR